MPGNTSLEGRTAIVTGASKGIGKATALALAQAGADVAMASRKAADLEAAAEEVRALGKEVMAVPTDVSRSGDVDALVGKTLERFGKIDILVNNAGFYLEVASVPFPDVTLKPPDVSRESSTPMSDEEWAKIMDTNLAGVFYCCRAVAPHMLERRYGKIINVTSVSARQAFRLEAAYCASKAGVEMLTRCLALEWASYNVSVNCVGPGSFHTEMTGHSWTDPGRRQDHLDAIPMHKEGDIRDLGAAAVYLAGPASDYITGQSIYIDGGMSAY